MSKQYINSSNQAPNLSLGTIVLWFMAIQVFHWPEWAYGVWGVGALVLVVGFFVRIATEEGVNVVERKK